MSLDAVWTLHKQHAKLQSTVVWQQSMLWTCVKQCSALRYSCQLVLQDKAECDWCPLEALSLGPSLLPSCTHQNSLATCLLSSCHVCQNVRSISIQMEIRLLISFTQTAFLKKCTYQSFGKLIHLRSNTAHNCFLLRILLTATCSCTCAFSGGDQEDAQQCALQVYAGQAVD